MERRRIGSSLVKENSRAMTDAGHKVYQILAKGDFFITMAHYFLDSFKKRLFTTLVIPR